MLEKEALRSLDSNIFGMNIIEIRMTSVELVDRPKLKVTRLAPHRTREDGIHSYCSKRLTAGRTEDGCRTKNRIVYILYNPRIFRWTFVWSKYL